MIKLENWHLILKLLIYENGIISSFIPSIFSHYYVNPFYKTLDQNSKDKQLNKHFYSKTHGNRKLVISYVYKSHTLHGFESYNKYTRTHPIQELILFKSRYLKYSFKIQLTSHHFQKASSDHSSRVLSIIFASGNH